MPGRLLQKLRSFRSHPPFVQAWLVPAWFLLGGARLALLLVPFRRIAPHLGRSTGAVVPATSPEAAQATKARWIGEAVRLAARYTPWTSNCLPQAIAARWMLGLHDIPYALYLGIRRTSDEARVSAHAWVISGSIHVTGGDGSRDHQVVGVFVGEGSTTDAGSTAG